jgi:hypothetical protein
MTVEQKRGGIVLEDGDRLFFVPAHVAERVAVVPAVAPVPGAHSDLLGIALIEGAIVPVVAIGSHRSTMLLVSYLGEPIGLVGGNVLATGTFESAGDGASVRYDGHVLKPLDVAAIYTRLQTGSWAGRRS